MPRPPAPALAIDPRAIDPTLLGLLRLLAKSPQPSQREVASSLGVSLGKANHCLRTLIARGFVRAQDYRTNRKRPGYRYLLTPSGLKAKAELTRQFLACKTKEYDALRLEIERLQRESDGIEP